MPKTHHVTLVCTFWTKKITKNTVGSRGRVSSSVRKPLCVSFWRYTEFFTWKKSRNSVKFRGISRNYTSRNSAEFRRNCSQFRTEYRIDGSKKKPTEFRGHPILWPKTFWARIYRPSFRDNSPKRSFSMTENERFGLVFAKLVYKSGHRNYCSFKFCAFLKPGRVQNVECIDQRFILHLRSRDAPELFISCTVMNYLFSPFRSVNKSWLD